MRTILCWAALALSLAGATLAGSTSLGYQGGQVSSILHTNAGTTLASFGYSYDHSGHLTQEVDNGSTTAFGNDAAGQLTSAGTASYSYDADGNLSGAGVSVATLLAGSRETGGV